MKCLEIHKEIHQIHKKIILKLKKKLFYLKYTELIIQFSIILCNMSKIENYHCGEINPNHEF